jgi:integrase
MTNEFDIDDFDTKVLFKDGPVGKNQISAMLKMLCQITGQPKFTNHSLRATGICILKSYGFDDRTIAKLTGKYQFPMY